MINLRNEVETHLKNLCNGLADSVHALEKDAAEELQRLKGDGGELAELGKLLKRNETMLMQQLEESKTGAGNGGTSTLQAGHVEFGMALAAIESMHPELARMLGMPSASLTQTHMDSAMAGIAGGIVLSDGTIVGTATYEELDTGWAYAPLNYMRYLIEPSKMAKFRTGNVVVPAPSTARVSVYGDWGTGYFADGNLQSPAQMVMEQLLKQNADYNVHLGDVYYSGTGPSGWPAGEESANFIQLIAGSKLKNNVTLNSNHEMYDGANGYFQALDSGAFAAQGGIGYFAIESDHWIMVGLDSAYDATRKNTGSLLYMDGSIREPAQLEFLAKCAAKKKPLILFCHHPCVSLDGKTATKLWDEVTAALGRVPEFWYFGHTHTGVAYSSQSFPGQRGCVARCLGHAAIPYGKASSLFQNKGQVPEVDWVAHEPLSQAFPNTTPAQSKRVLNGFACLDLSPTGLTETVYTQTGSVVFQKSFPFA